MLLVVIGIIVKTKFCSTKKGVYNLKENGVKSPQPKTESPETGHVSPERETTPHETDETDDPTRSAGECTLGDHEVMLDLSDINII